MCRVERVSALGCWLLAVGLPASAHAHGGRPQTSDVLFGASADDMVIASTFGTMTTLDGGATWQWICMESMPDATRGVIRPAVRTTDDTILFAQHFGLLEGHDRACDPVYEATLQNEYVADVTAIPGGGYAALPSDPTVVNRLYTSVDGAVFAPLGDAFPADFLPERVRYAPGDPMRVYVSGETPGSATSRYTASLFVSDDGGSHWTGIDVPLVDGETVLRVLDVDPHDPDRAFLVAQSSMTDRLIEVTMAGATLTDRLVIPAVSVAVNRPFGFAFAADGAIWFGNTMAGLFRMLPGDTPRSIDKFLHTACVVAHDDDVYFCGDGLIDAFAVGVQHPGPEYAPVPLMRFAQLTVPRMCGEPTDGLCVRWWDDLLRDTGRGDLVPDAGDADAGPTSGTDAGAPSPAASCGCRTAGDTHASRRMAVLVAVLAAALGALAPASPLRHLPRVSRWLVIVLTALLVSVSGIETLEAAFVVESHQCEDDDDSCPPFSDDCGDCARCVHVTGVPTTTVVLTWMPFPDRVATPSVSTSATPPDAPTSEILTVPRA